MNKRILVVEDEKEIHELMQIYLSDTDIEIHPALTGEEGIEIYKKLTKEGRKIDLIVTGFNLPGIDGIETTKRIIQINPSAKVYAFTASLDTDLANDFKKAGAKDVIPKTVGLVGFKEIVKKILTGKN